MIVSSLITVKIKPTIIIIIIIIIIFSPIPLDFGSGIGANGLTIIYVLCKRENGVICETAE